LTFSTIVAGRRFGRSGSRSGHWARTRNQSPMTQIGALPPSTAALRKAYSIASSARLSTVDGMVSATTVEWHR